MRQLFLFVTVISLMFGSTAVFADETPDPCQACKQECQQEKRQCRANFNGDMKACNQEFMTQIQECIDLGPECDCVLAAIDTWQTCKEETQECKDDCDKMARQQKRQCLKEAGCL